MNVASDSVCRHFGTCGGCTYQGMPADAYRALKRQIVVDALERDGLAGMDVAPMVETPPASRRRATFKAEKRNGETLIGFNAAASHAIVDMQECRVLTPAMFRLVAGLRDMMAEWLQEGGKAELYVLQADNGFDIAIAGVRAGEAATVWIARWTEKLRLIRVTAGDQILVELAPPAVSIGLATVNLPPSAFLQPTRAGEERLQKLVLKIVTRRKNVADLFGGVGTFALRLAEIARVHAVDADAAALKALTDAARTAQKLKPVTTLKRDLFRQPLGGVELKSFDAVVLDPPRAGAARQVDELARSKVPLVCYVSCDPASFARDARRLVAGGYRLGPIIPVDQFVWASHIELVASFSRD
jgi:23S rRNA (uracil1939-C5)-methyltransferase